MILRSMLVLILLLSGAIIGGAPGNGSIACPASGNKAVSPTHIRAQWVEFVNPSANSGSIYMGGATITTGGATSGAFMTTSSSWLWPPIANSSPYDLSQIYFACGTSTDTLYYTYFQ